MSEWERRHVQDCRLAAAEDLVEVMRGLELAALQRLAWTRQMPPLEAVRFLVGHRTWSVRAAVARNRRLSAEAEALCISALADVPDPRVRAALLDRELDRVTREGLLAGLAPAEVRYPQSWMPVGVLEAIVAGPAPPTGRSRLDSSDVPRQPVEADGWDSAQQRAAAIACLPGDSATLARMCSGDDVADRKAAAWNPALPPPLRAVLARDDDPGVRQAAVGYSVDLQVLARAAGDEDVSVREETADVCVKIACFEEARPEDRRAAGVIVQRLAADPDDGVRAVAAGSPDTHDQLVGDPSRDVRQAVAQSTQDPVLLNRLAGDSEPDVREWLAESTTDQAVLRRLARDSHYWVVAAVAGNRDVDPGVLTELAVRWQDTWTYAQALQETGWRAESRDPDSWSPVSTPEAWTVLDALAKNPRLPHGERIRLALHPDTEVADAALQQIPRDPHAIPAEALRPRWRRGLLWQLLAHSGAPVHNPNFRHHILARLPTATGSVADLWPTSGPHGSTER